MLYKLLKDDGSIIKTKDDLFWFSGYSEGLALVGVVMDKTYANSGTCDYYIDTNGDIAIEHDINENYSIITGESFSEGHVAVLLYDKAKRKRAGYGYIDNKGHVVISPQFETASSFNIGIAHVSINNKKEGYINKAGELIFTYKNK